MTTFTALFREPFFDLTTHLPNFTLCRRLDIREHLWAEYQTLHDRLIKIEQVLKQTYFSHEKMQVFREKALRQLTNTHSLEEQVIRQHEDIFPETMFADQLRKAMAHLFSGKPIHPNTL